VLVGGAYVREQEQVATTQAVDGRERIVSEAHALFTSRGFTDVSMQQIADGAGITKATMYHYFRSKEDLFIEVCLREIRRTQGGIEGQIAVGGTFRERIDRVVSFLLGSMARSDTGRLFADLSRHVAADRRHAIIHEAGHPMAGVRLLFEQAMAAGEIRTVDLDVIVPLFFGMVFGPVRFALHEGHPERLQRDLASIVVGVLIDGIGCGGRSE
jgi:AcrR family transcriptional regulator